MMVRNRRRSILAGAAMAGLLAGAFPGHVQAVGVSRDGPGKIIRQMEGGKESCASKSACNGKHYCKGRNDCKGQGGCKSGDNGCQGKNSCQGKGGCNAIHGTTHA